MTEIKTNGILETYDISEVGITDGLVAWYPLDGNTRDYTEYRNDATNYGATISSGLDQLCYSFDGVDDYIKVNNNLTSGLIGLTVGAWIKPMTGGSNYRCAVHKGVDNSVGGSEYWIGVSGGGFLTATIGARDGVGWSGGETTTTAVMGTWYFMSATWDGTNVRVYIDGNLAKTYALASKGSIEYPTRFGASADGTAYQYSGLTQDVRIYNRALSAEEIKILYELRKNKKMHFHQSGKVFIPGKFNEVY